MKRLILCFVSLCCALELAAQQSLAPAKAPYYNFTTGIQFQGSFGINGQCAISTGTGTSWGTCAGGLAGVSPDGANGIIVVGNVAAGSFSTAGNSTAARFLVGPGGVTQLDLSPGRYDARLCSTSLWVPFSVSNTDVTSVLQPCINTQIAAGRSIYIPYEYEVDALRLPPAAELWCDNVHAAGFIQNPAGTGVAGTDNFPSAIYATVANQTYNDTNPQGIRIHGCLIEGNKALIYANALQSGGTANPSANPGNVHPIEGLYINHGGGTGSIHPLDLVENSWIRNASSNCYDFSTHNTDGRHTGDVAYSCDGWGMKVNSSDMVVDGCDIGQSLYDGMLVNGGGSVRVVNCKSWFSGHSMVWFGAGFVPPPPSTGTTTTQQITAVANASAGNTTVTGTFSNNCTYWDTVANATVVRNRCLGETFAFLGFTNSANNGNFVLQSITCNQASPPVCSFTVNNPSGVAETPPTTARIYIIQTYSNRVPVNFDFFQSAVGAAAGAWNASALAGQDALGPDMYFGGTGSAILNDLEATNLVIDSPNYANLPEGNSGVCILANDLTNSVIDAACAKQETATLGVPGGYLGVTVSTGNRIYINGSSYSGALQWVGDATSFQTNYIEINNWHTQPVTIPFTSSWGPDPTLGQKQVMTLTGNLSIVSPIPSHTFIGETLDLTVINDGTHSTTFSSTYLVPQNCSWSIAAGAQNTYRFMAVAASSSPGSWVMVPFTCPSAAGVGIADGAGGWSGTKTVGSGTAVATTSDGSSTANNAVCEADTSGTKYKDCGATPGGEKFMTLAQASSGNTIGTSTGSLGMISPAMRQAATLDDVSLQLGTLPTGSCSPFAVVSLVDVTASNAILASGTLDLTHVAVTFTISNSAVPLNHQLQARVTTAAAGCTTNATSGGLIIQYH